MKKLIYAVLSIVVFVSSPAFSDTSCFKKPSNYEQGKAVGGAKKEQSTMDQYKKTDGGAMEILLCNAQLAYEGPHTIFKNCGCRQAIKKACSFKWKDGILRASGKDGATTAMCTPWLPIATFL